MAERDVDNYSYVDVFSRRERFDDAISVIIVVEDAVSFCVACISDEHTISWILVFSNTKCNRLAWFTDFSAGRHRTQYRINSCPKFHSTRGRLFRQRGHPRWKWRQCWSDAWWRCCNL